jgi:TolB-like protein
MNGNVFRPGRRLGVRLLVLVLGLSLTTTGCSFIWVTRPVPKEEVRQYASPPPCTDSYWMPALDTAALALFGGFAIYFASMSKEQYLAQSSSSSSSKDPNGRYYSATSMGVLALTGLASAIYGFHYVAKCKNQPPMEPTFEAYAAPPGAFGPPAPAPPPPGFATVQVRGKHLAVLEFQGKNLDPDILMTFSDTVRGGALQALEPHGVVVMTRENMLVLLRDMGKKECGEGDCEVETARNIGADYVISGKVVRVEQSYFVTLKLHETQGGSLLGTDTVEGASQVELLRALREHARQLTTAAFGPGPDFGPPAR